MAVYYKFKSAKDYDSVAIDGHFISVGHLKEKIFELKHLGRGTDFDLDVTNAQTNEEYPDEGMLIPKNTSVLVRRVPGRPRRRLISASIVEQEEPKVDIVSDDVQAVNNSIPGADSSAINYAEDLEWDEFGSDLYAIPETVPVQSSIPLQDAAPVSKEDEESKIKALIETPALDWQRQPDGFGPGRGFGRGIGGRMISGRGFGRGGYEKKTPPQGYICHRCKVPGHLIQHCPTNGDPNFDVGRFKPPTGIPKSMLVAASDGSYALPSGAVAVLKPNEAAFEREIEGMPSTRPIGDLPPELHCPLCKEVMKDAVLTSRCCFTSFCDRCIRDHIMSKSMCICGATNVLADDLLPNKTLRDTINRILESNNNSAENGGSAFQIQDMESRNPHAKVPSPTQSAASRGLEVSEPPSLRVEKLKVTGAFEENKYANEATQPDKVQTSRVLDVSEATHDSKNLKDAVSQGSAPLPDEEVQQKPVSEEIGKKKKKKKVRGPPGAAEMQWRAPNPQDLVPDNYMMNFGPSGFNPYWNGIQPGLDGFMPPYGGHMPYMGYGIGPMDASFGGILPHNPFGGPSYMMPYGPPPPRDLSELAMGYNGGPPVMSREEFEARKADLKRKREIERRTQREFPKDRDHGREGSSTFDVSSRSKSNQKSNYHPSDSDHHYIPRGRSPSDGRSRGMEPSAPSSKKRDDHHRSPPPEGRSRGPEPPIPSSKKREHRSPTEARGLEPPISSSKKRDHRSPSGSRGAPEPSSKKRDVHSRGAEHPILPSKKSSEDHDQRQKRSSKGRSESPSTDKKIKGSVFSRISFPEHDSSSTKKRKLSSSTDAPTSSLAANGSHDDRKRSNADHDSSDDERHFKRRPSRYDSSPPPQSRGSRERDRKHR